MKLRLALACSATVLVAAVLVYFTTRTPTMPVAAPPATDVERGGAELASAVEDPAPEAARRTSVTEEPPGVDAAAPGTNVLRVVLEGITEEESRRATVALTGVDERDGWYVEIQDPWPALGLTSEFDLDPVLATMERHASLRKGEIEVAVAHPQLLGERTRVSLANGVELASGETVHEVRVRLVRPEFWPELTLAVRDAHTGAHLEDIELRVHDNRFGMTFWGRNGASTALGGGLRSPIALMGGRDADQSESRVAGLALSPAAGESARLVGLTRRVAPERGVIVSARAPGYAWGSTALDVSQGERELLLEPAATLGVRLANVQRERYAALETVPMLGVYRVREDGGSSSVHYEPLDDTLEAEGLRLDSLVPGGYRVAVELGGGSWTEQPVLALEELSLAAGETRELLLALEDPPSPPERATLGGVISFPAPTAAWGEQDVRLQLYFQPTQRWMNPDYEFSLADLPRVGGALPTWSFRVEDLAVGTYRVQLMPFLKVCMIDLPAEGAEDLELVLPELAEVLVETVDGRTGERVPRSDLYYRNLEPVPGQLQRELARAETEEPGRFRFWAAPGAVMVWPQFPNGAEREFGGNGMRLELVPGRQSVKFEFAPVYAMRFEFREDGTALPTGPQGMHTTQDIRAVGHEGRVTDGGLQRDMVVEVSDPGLYEISFERVTGDRYHPIPPRRVDLRAGETTAVIVELRRR